MTKTAQNQETVGQVMVNNKWTIQNTYILLELTTTWKVLNRRYCTIVTIVKCGDRNRQNNVPAMECGMWLWQEKEPENLKSKENIEQMLLSNTVNLVSCSYLQPHLSQCVTLCTKKPTALPSHTTFCKIMTVIIEAHSHISLQATNWHLVAAKNGVVTARGVEYTHNKNTGGSLCY